MIEQLVSREDFFPYKTIPASFDTNMLAVCIVRAQDSDLRDLLGRAMYKQVLDNRASEPYLSLIRGTAYELNGEEIDFRGLVPFLVWNAYRYLLKETKAQMTASGAKIKTSPESATPSDDWFKTEEQEALAQAGQWANEVREYINANRADFPNYSPVGHAVSGSFQISSIVQPKYSSGK